MVLNILGTTAVQAFAQQPFCPEIVRLTYVSDRLSKSLFHLGQRVQALLLLRNVILINCINGFYTIQVNVAAVEAASEIETCLFVCLYLTCCGICHSLHPTVRH